MQKKALLNTNTGFSLIELMIVVAIIGLLAAIGIPQYAKFQAKARQSEVKSQLNSIFTAEKSFQSEWNEYTVDLKNAGMGVEGKLLRYVTGFVTGTACTGYVTTSGAPAEVTTNTQTIATPVIGGSGATWHATVGTAGTAVAAAVLAGTACTGTTFTAKGIGDPRNTPAALAAASSDQWTIDDQKLISNTVSGL